MVKRKSAKVGPRDVAAEIIRRARATASRDGESLPYVLRFSDPPTANERLQLAACRILGRRVAIMPAKVPDGSGVVRKIRQAGPTLIGVHEPQKSPLGRNRSNGRRHCHGQHARSHSRIDAARCRATSRGAYTVRCCNMKTATMLLWFPLRPPPIRWYALWTWSRRLHISGFLRNASTAPAWASTPSGPPSTALLPRNPSRYPPSMLKPKPGRGPTPWTGALSWPPPWPPQRLRSAAWLLPSSTAYRATWHLSLV